MLRDRIFFATAALAAVATSLLSPEAFAQNKLPRDQIGPVAHTSDYPTISDRLGGMSVDPTVSGTWTPLVNPFPGGGRGPDTALLLTDGSVVMHQVCTPNWYRLVPDRFGSYVNGTWSTAFIGDNAPLSPMIGSGMTPDGYGPLYYASAVLPDGRLIVQGGEYEWTATHCFQDTASTKGSLFNPLTNTWSAVPPPPGWTTIGDANSILLGPNGITGSPVLSSYMIGNCCQSGLPGRQQAVATIDPIPGTGVTWTLTGQNTKADANSEEGWTLLPNGDVLTVDTQNENHAERFVPGSNTWVSTGTTPVFLGNNAGLPIGPEMGPAVSIGGNIAVQFGANPNTAVFVYPDSWTAGPRFPDQEETADGPAALLPNGNILVQTSNFFTAPSLFWEFNPNGLTLTSVANPPCHDGANTNVPAYQGRMLVLPTGQILWDAGEGDPRFRGANCTSIYTPNPNDGSPNRALRPLPRIANQDDQNAQGNQNDQGNQDQGNPTVLTRGGTNYSVTGTSFRDVSQGATYGDDPFTMTTNLLEPGHRDFPPAANN
jgi:hypothetical protein